MTAPQPVRRWPFEPVTTALLVALATLLCVLALAMFPNVFRNLGGNSSLGDARIQNCYGSGDRITVDVKVANSTNRIHDYLVTIAVDDPAGQRIGTGVAIARALRPGESTVASVSVSVSSASTPRCEIAEVSRS